MTLWGKSASELRRSAAVGGTIVRLLAATAWDLAVRRESARARFAERLRAAFERLGPTFVKLGQFLAVRFDLLPLDICRSLEQLFENVRRLPFAAVQRVIEAELQRPLSEAFAAFVPEPIAAASIAQVHVAWTHAGDKVAVKVQRPGIGELVRTDIRIMRRLARVADAVGAFGAVSVTEMIGQFSYYAQREIDFVEEGRTADTLRRNASHGEIIPVIHWSLTTPMVLTLEFIEGVSLGEVATELRAGAQRGIRRRLPHLDMGLALHNLTFSALHQLFVTGAFHGDPHPGNVIVCADNRVALIDFGIAGSLGERDRRLLRGYLGFLALGDFEKSYRHYSQLFEATPDSDMAAFKRETLALMRQWHRYARDPAVPPRLRAAGRFSDAMSGLIRQHRLRMSLDTLLFWRVLIVLDSTALRFTAHFDLLGAMRRFFVEHQAEEFLSEIAGRFQPEQIYADARRALASAGLARRALARADVRQHALLQPARASEHAATARESRLAVAIAATSLLVLVAILLPSSSPALTVALGVGGLVLAGWSLHAERA